MASAVASHTCAATNNSKVKIENLKNRTQFFLTFYFLNFDFIQKLKSVQNAEVSDTTKAENIY